MRMTRRTVFTALTAAVALGAAACGGSPSGQAGGSTAADPLANVPAGKILSRAFANFKSASSVQVSGTAADSGQTVALDLTLVKGGACRGTISMSKSGTLALIDTGKQAWIKPDTTFWKSTGAASAAVLSVVSGKYLALSGNSGMTEFTSLCTLSGLAGNVNGTLVKGARSTVDGQPVITLRDPAQKGTAYITDTATPELTRIESTATGNSGELNFTDYGSLVTITAPPASQVLNGSKYGF
jgi:hypothetical protein